MKLVDILTAAGLAVLGSALAFFSARYFAGEAARKELLTRVGELERNLATVNQAVLPISAAFQALLIKQLTHYHTPTMDALMVKLENGTLTDAEEKKLIALLKRRTRDMGAKISAQERIAAHILPHLMLWVRMEKVAVAAPVPTTLQVVVVPEPTPEPEPEEEKP